MKLVWDDPKREWTIVNRAYDFADLEPVANESFLNATILGARAGRFKAVGTFGETVIAVIFKPLGAEAISIISTRRASRKERTAHDKTSSSRRSADR